MGLFNRHAPQVVNRRSLLKAALALPCLGVAASYAGGSCHKTVRPVCAKLARWTSERIKQDSEHAFSPYNIHEITWTHWSIFNDSLSITYNRKQDCGILCSRYAINYIDFSMKSIKDIQQYVANRLIEHFGVSTRYSGVQFDDYSLYGTPDYSKLIHIS